MIQHIKGCHLKNTRKNTAKQKKNCNFCGFEFIKKSSCDRHNKNIHGHESAAALTFQQEKKMRKRSIHKEKQIIVRKIPQYLKELFYPQLLSSQMKVVPKILYLVGKETKDVVTIRKKERKLMVSPDKKKIWRKKGM